MITSIFGHTQSSFSEHLTQLLGKGREHARLLYTHWYRYAELESLKGKVESQAVGLLEKMIGLVDFSLPELSAKREEGGTVKFLLRFADGLESESVLIPMQSGNTLCISSQVGCKRGCAFCETGKMGLLRSLSAEEIVSQVFYARFCLPAPVRNLVFMGMGEPFDNFDEVMRAIRILTDSGGLGLGCRRITVSTSGCVDEIYRFAKEADPAINLAVSINAPNDEVRDRLMPVNKRWKMSALKEALQFYCADSRRSILIEYVLIKGWNESLADAEELANYLEGLRVKVNLIPYNPQSRGPFEPPDVEAREAFLAAMRRRGFRTLLRQTKGRAIMAACGQLGKRKSILANK
jgi:23S rRNA (adenine2503-C2)-methyltransferase